MEVHSKFLIILQVDIEHLFLYHRVSHHYVIYDIFHHTQYYSQLKYYKIEDGTSVRRFTAIRRLKPVAYPGGGGGVLWVLEHPHKRPYTS